VVPSDLWIEVEDPYDKYMNKKMASIVAFTFCSSGHYLPWYFPNIQGLELPEDFLATVNEMPP
jgi:hypothetical protein